MLRDIPKPTQLVYKGNWRKPYNPTQAVDTSARARRYNSQSRELWSRCSDIHTGPEIAHTSEGLDPKRNTPAPRPRTTWVVNTSAWARRYDTQSRELQSYHSDIHTGLETAHTSEDRNPKRNTPAPRPRTTRADDTSTQARRDNT
jgi:hypothetical protein